MDSSPIKQVTNPPSTSPDRARGHPAPIFTPNQRTPNRQVKLEDRRCGSTRIRTSFRKILRQDAWTSPATTRTWASACARCRRCSISTVRKKIVDGHKDYAADPVLPAAAGREASPRRRRRSTRCIRIINDGFAELCAKRSDHFPGWVAQISLDAPDAGVGEAERAIKELGALGVQIYTNVARQAARPAAIPAVLEEDERARQADLDASRRAAPRCRTITRREEVALRDLVDVRLVLRDRLPRWRALVILKIMDNHPEPQDHHPPFRRHRADARRPHRAGLGRAGLAHLR